MPVAATDQDLGISRQTTAAAKRKTGAWTGKGIVTGQGIETGHTMSPETGHTMSPGTGATISKAVISLSDCEHYLGMFKQPTAASMRSSAIAA